MGLTPTFFVGGRCKDLMRTRKSMPETPETAAGALTSLTPEIAAELAAIATGAGCELLHAEWKGGVLRLVLDRSAAARAATEPGASDHARPARPESPESPERPERPPDAAKAPGVSLADCELVAKQASALLDVLDFGNGHYLLEVSSPGLDRQLYGPADYRRFLGRLARITYEIEAAAGPVAPAGPARQAARFGAGSKSPAPAGRRRRTVVARLADFRPPVAAAGAGAGEVTLIDDKTGERLTLHLEDIRLARLEIEL